MPQPISIKNFNQGIAETPAVGFGLVRADISRNGYLKSNRNVNNMKNNLTDRVKHMVQDPKVGGVYALDGDGNLWRKNSLTWGAIGNVNTTQAEGNGLAIYKDYIFKARRNRIDVAPISSASIWTDDWATVNAQGYSVSPHPMFRSENDKLYIGDGRYIHYVDAGASFTPGGDSLVLDALDLPANYVVKGFAEVGIYLLVLAEEPNAGRVAVFPWNKTSSSFNLPIFINENSALGIKVQLNKVYVLAGQSIYESNLTTSSEVFDFEFLSNDTDFLGQPSFGTQPMFFNGGELLIGVGKGTSSTIGSVGVYSLDKGALSLKAGISTGSDGSEGGNIAVDSVFVTNDKEIIFGWQDNQTYGIDIISEERDRAYNSYLESQIYLVSQSAEPQAFTKVEVYLNKKLGSGDGFKISYREGVEEDWVPITSGGVTDGDFDFGALGGVAHTVFPAVVPATPTVQFKVELKKDINIREIIIS